MNVDDRFLDRLVSRIAAGQVVPVIGEELRRCETPSGLRTAEQLVAEDITRHLGLSTTDRAPSLSDLAHEFLRRDRRHTLDGFRELVVEAVEARRWVPAPPLAQLASIEGFRVFLTTGFDPLISRALEAGDGRPPARGGFAVNARDKDLPASGDGRIVYHLFGAADVLTRFAVTEEDLLESLLQLQAHAPALPLLSGTLQQSHLLLLGCTYPDWLTRLFLRIARQKRLAGERDEAEYVAVAPDSGDPSLVRFLERFSARTQLLAIAPEALLEALARRWAAQRPVSGNPTSESAPAVFISYAREDRAAADALYAALTREGLDAWLDKSDHADALKPGDAYRDRIRERIAGTELFVPIVSRAAADRAEGFYRLEWEWALERGRLIAPDVPFLLPVRVDSVSHDHPGVPRAIREIDWADSPDHDMSGAARAVRDAVRSVRLRRKRGVT